MNDNVRVTELSGDDLPHGRYFVAPDSAPPVAPTMFQGLKPASVEKQFRQYTREGAQGADVSRLLAPDAQVAERFASDKSSAAWAMNERLLPGSAARVPPDALRSRRGRGRASHGSTPRGQ